MPTTWLNACSTCGAEAGSAALTLPSTQEPRTCSVTAPIRVPEMA